MDEKEITPVESNHDIGPIMEISSEEANRRANEEMGKQFLVWMGMVAAFALAFALGG